MADFEEILQDTGEDVKRFFKKNPFIILCIGVGAVALAMWWVREKNAATAAQDETLMFAGYPTISGGGEIYDSQNNDYWQTVIDDMRNSFGEELDNLNSGWEEKYDNLNSTWEDKYTNLSDKHQTDIDNLTDKHQTDIDNLNSSWSDKYDSLLDKLDNVNDGYVQQYYPVYSGSVSNSQKVDEQAIIEQMKANSAAWHTSNSTNQEILHDLNESLGASIGASFHPGTGTWWKNGQQLYTLSPEAEEEVTGTGKKSVPSATATYQSNADYNTGVKAAVTYDKNTDYSALITQAKQRGASQAEIDGLTAQREAKIVGEKMTEYYKDLK